jgi:hypothetical protein
MLETPRDMKTLHERKDRIISAFRVQGRVALRAHGASTTIPSKWRETLSMFAALNQIVR